LKVLVVDDEFLARKRITSLLNEVPQMILVGECNSGRTAIEQINEKCPDLIFLDINMKDMNGFNILKNIKIHPKPIVVFVTAYDSYALKAFDYNAFDFLLKPFKDDRFFKTVKRVSNLSGQRNEEKFQKQLSELMSRFQQSDQRDTILNKIPIKSGTKTKLINIDTIEYILGSGCYIELYSSGKKHVLRDSLTNILTRLNERKFVRVHRSAIVNIEFIEEIVHSAYSESDARMKDNKTIRISKSKRKDLFEAIGIK
jgi:two-component system LytT family response regulator